MNKYILTCIDCRKTFEPDAVDYVCPVCSQTQKPFQPLRGLLSVDYDWARLGSTLDQEVFAENPMTGHGRYLDLLPLNNLNSLPALDVGPTPLDPVLRMRVALGLKNLFVKNDTLLPTGSFKDRASSVVVAKARELGKDVITTASTGNAATALAGMCASVGMKSVIFVPETAPQAKLAQIAMFGARLIPIKGTYDDAVALCKQSSDKFGWYNRSTGYNPYTVEGKKTAALEIWEQLGFQVPHKVLVPTGDGVILTGVYKGFYDLKQLGLIDHLPQIIPVQADGSSAIVNALNDKADHVTSLVLAQTVADSISVSAPACGDWALRIVRETQGFGIRVADQEIISAIRELASLTGIFAEPAAATAYAGLKKAVASQLISSDETVVLLITGTGLKDVPTAMRAVTIPESIEPKIELVVSL
ncbi:MAG: Threonine synthase [uncultured bacterium]|nr:MAG: Threonine synthase [uncultured bacterium]